MRLDSQAFKKICMGIALIGILVVPRVALLYNGLDAQRIWDTNTPDAFRFLDAVRSHQLLHFLATDHKYPLFGSLLFIPVIGLYYLSNYWQGVYSTSLDFIHAYVLGTTRLFFWIRFEMIVFNLAGVAGCYLLVKHFLKSWWAAVAAVAFAAVQFYVTLFSVQPRIHSLAFAAAPYALYATFLLVTSKKWRNYGWAFGGCAVVLALAQSGITLLAGPLLAHFYNPTTKQWSFFSRNAYANIRLWCGLGIYALIGGALGYPQLFISRLTFAGQAAPILSADHSVPHFAWYHLVAFLGTYAFLIDPLIAFFVGAAIYLGFRKKISLARVWISPYVVVCLTQILFFLALFGTTDLISGRFALIIVPATLYLMSALLPAVWREPPLRILLICLYIFQAYGLWQVVRIASAGDTRGEAASYLLAQTSVTTTIYSSLSPSELGILPSLQDPTMSAVLEGEDNAIRQRDRLVSPHERKIVVWNTPAAGQALLAPSAVGSYAVADGGGDGLVPKTAVLVGFGFKQIYSISAARPGNPETGIFLPWDIPTPFPHLPLTLVLRQIAKMGPTVYIFERP